MATLKAATKAASKETRLVFIDNIRWTMIVLVICHHAAVTYSHVGGWYYLDPAKPALLVRLLLASFETFDQAYFMGLLFLIAGYFVPRAFDSKSPAVFLRDRALRLGLPSLVYMLVIHPVTVYWLLRTFDDPSIPSLTQAYGRFLSSGRFLSATGPMWFAVALLIFCVAYAAIRVSFSPRRHLNSPQLPGNRQIIGVALLMGTCSFLVRIVQPIGTNVLNMQLCYFSQYIILFTAGILSYRGDWLRQIPRQLALRWMLRALAIGVPAWLVILGTSGAVQGNTTNLLGGFHWQSAAFSYWEAFFCLGMCLGLLVLFRDVYNKQGRFERWMSRNSFTAYFLHPPLLISVTLALKHWAAPVLIKFAVASLIAVPLTFLVSGFLRPRIPGLRRWL